MGPRDLSGKEASAHLRNLPFSLLPTNSDLPLAKMRRTLRCLVTTNRRDPDSTLHRLDTMGSPH
jgi:hypothetical protein